MEVIYVFSPGRVLFLFIKYCDVVMIAVVFIC